MTIPELGNLEEVDLRQAWPHEARSFTPWLSENLEILSSVIGIPLELEGQEVAVEQFSADILARNPRDDSRVLIENQLEQSNHEHMGQIMTYLAGLDVNTVIWIAAGFKEPHLSAIRWLNEHTIEPFAFFAIKLKIVRIADSPMAPVFEVVVKPNTWERQLQSIAKETQSLSVVGELRRKFWTCYLEKYPEEAQYGSANGSSNRWRTVTEADLVVSSYMAKRSVGLFVRGHTGVDQRAERAGKTSDCHPLHHGANDRKKQAQLVENVTTVFCAADHGKSEETGKDAAHCAYCVQADRVTDG